MNNPPTLLSPAAQRAAPSPPMLIVTLTPIQRQNLVGFLQRVQLSGREVPAFTEIFQLIQRAVLAEPSGGTPDGATGTVALPQKSAITEQQSII